MSGPGQILREIHRLQRHARELAVKIEQGPRMLRAHQANVQKQTEALHQGQEIVKKSKVKQRDLESNLKAAQQQVEKYQKQLNDVKSKKEYDTVKVEIASSQQHVRKIEDQILEVMGEIEAKNALVPDLEKSVQKAQAELGQFERDCQEKLARFAQERAEALKKLAEVEATLPDNIKEHYKRMVTAKGEEALAGLHGQSCAACYTEVTSQAFSDLKRGQFVLCKSCGRILYLAEDF